MLLSAKINCFIGHNGAGKTNVLDAVYYLSFCHSASNPNDAQVIRHGQDLLMVEGEYSHDPTATPAECSTDASTAFTVAIGMKRGQKKHVKRNKKEYKRLSEHIGLIPIVMISPQDVYLIAGGSEERRRLMDVVIAQMNRSYIEALTRYNKALQQRNTLLKQDTEPDADILSIFEEQMAVNGEEIFRQRSLLAERLTPLFQLYYERISGGREQVSLQYVSHCQRGPLLEVIQRDRWKDRAMGYSLHGVHRDDLEIMLDGHPMKREGSQGQQKTFVTSLKLAQFEMLRQAIGEAPILLLDDIFDKLDARRVKQIVELVQGDGFGQIFITDTNREHLDHILTTTAHDYRIFEVSEGCIQGSGRA